MKMTDVANDYYSDNRTAGTPRRPLREWLTLVDRKVNVRGIAALAALALAWQIASRFYPAFLFPSIERVGVTALDLLAKATALAAIASTLVRILIYSSLSFGIATTLGIVAGLNRGFERTIVPLIELMQGVPAVCWIIFAILWFRDTEVRIGFIIVATTLSSFFYQARDGVRAIPADLWNMVRALRPSPWQFVQKLLLPALLPSILTAWRINVGAATRVTIMAELLGGLGGIGNQLRLSQELFRMDRAIVWTLVLVAFVVAVNGALSLIERAFAGWHKPREAEHD
jgi:NitT/TauT family transport system permease protein